MTPAVKAHPSPDELRAFALGKLPRASAASIELHLEQCDTCAVQLAHVPDDTLLQLARQAATESIRAAPPPEKDPTEIPAELIDHPTYRVTRLLGSGGMGTVYKAEHRLMERTVALKVISRRLTANAMAVERFRREIKAAGKLSHPNVVTAFDAVQAGELHYLVMEYVDGVSLDRLVARQGALLPTQAAHLIRQAAQGLAHAHLCNMIHRDIKPQNLMVTRKGQLKILDFGLARLMLDAPSPASGDAAAHGENAHAQQTAAGMVLGTPDYIAPEQARSAAEADIRSDLYSLGCTFYFLLTGQPPFRHGTLREKLEAHQSHVADPIGQFRSDVPAEMLAVIERLMAKDPAQRYQTPDEVVRALSPLVKGAESKPSAIVETAQPLVGRRPSSLRTPLRGGAIAAVLCAFVILGWSWFKQSGQSGAANVMGAVGKTGRVLYVIPSDMAWYPDYGPVRQRLEEAGLRVTTAATRAGPCQPYLDPDLPTPPPMTADVAIDAPLSADDYDAVIFGGFKVDPFFESHRAVTARLIADFRGQGKPVCAICTGQAVLAQHGVLDGKNAAGGKILNDNYPYHTPGGPKWTNQPVEVANSGRIITARDDQAAPEFAAAIIAKLNGNSDQD